MVLVALSDIVRRSLPTGTRGRIRGRFAICNVSACDEHVNRARNLAELYLLTCDHVFAIAIPILLVKAFGITVMLLQGREGQGSILLMTTAPPCQLTLLPQFQSPASERLVLVGRLSTALS